MRLAPWAAKQCGLMSIFKAVLQFVTDVLVSIEVDSNTVAAFIIQAETDQRCMGVKGLRLDWLWGKLSK